MTWRHQYQRSKPVFLGDASICQANRDLFARFFEFEEYKLKRTNGLPDLDEGCCKTLYAYLLKFRNVNLWFENKPWSELTKEDIKRVYDGLEDGTIKTKRGTPFQDRISYYNKIFRSKPFKLAGRDELAREVIEFVIPHDPPVRFATEKEFRRLVEYIGNPVHRFLVWLAWDIGENIDSLLQLTPEEFARHANPHTGEPEYLVSLAKAKLKRSRLSRTEITLYAETARLADLVLPKVSPGARIFPFCYRSAGQMLDRAVTASTAVTQPHGLPVRWKDLRSGMACHLLRHGWTREEVNARLGHVPSSDALDAYLNFMAIDRHAAKRRLERASDRLPPSVDCGAPTLGYGPPVNHLPVRLEQAQLGVQELPGHLANGLIDSAAGSAATEPMGH